MDNKKRERHFVACFLSKYTANKKPPIPLGVSSWKDAYRLFFPILRRSDEVFESFKNSLKNDRDRFDRFYDTNPRKGWDREKLSPSYELIKSAMDSMSDDDVFSYIKNIIQLSEVEGIISDDSIPNTEKEQVILSRVGQGKFKKDCLSMYPSCLITGIDLPFLLIASHIKPWSKSNNEERLSKYNGLILSPVYDKLFDRGFISFDTRGNLLISSEISDEDILRLNIKRNVKIAFHEETMLFLTWHRENHFKK
jgi:hypothetical protein